MGIQVRVWSVPAGLLWTITSFTVKQGSLQSQGAGVTEAYMAYGLAELCPEMVPPSLKIRPIA